MHLILILLFVGVTVLLVISLQKLNAEQDQPGTVPTAVQSPTGNSKHEFVFISKGKLFIHSSNNDIEEVHSPYVQEMIDRMNRKNHLHGWKQKTSLNMSFTGQAADLSADKVDLQVTSVQFVGNNKLIYFLKDGNVGGLFEYDAADKNERRLLHRQNLDYQHLSVNPESGKILCSQQHGNGIANIVMMNNDGGDSQQLTEGDTVDSAPAWIPGDDKNILYQSSGLARSQEGYVVAFGPASIKMLDKQKNEVVSVMDDPAVDYLQPRVDGQGNLYFIRRPYEAPRYSGTNLLLDFLLFPFRLLRAVFHYLNFFSLMYSQKPLTSASGPQVNADLKQMLIKGKRIDADRALRKESKVNGVPSLVPRSWQLVKRTRNGEETILATNVASFDITSDNDILYSNGYAVFELDQGHQLKVVLRDKLIADVIAS